MDVLETYTTYQQWFKLNKRVEEDKELPKKKVMKQLVNFVNDQAYTIEQKVKIILHHFINNTSQRIQGRARGMVVVRSRLHCVLYKQAFDKHMKEMGLPYGCLVGFSGTVTDKDTQIDYTENSMNKLPQGVDIADAFKDPRYRILIVSNKFQTGYDEPMLHSMYVDKTLSGLQCVQTLSRLNRTMSGKTDTFILDFVNTTDQILESFQDYYQKTILVGETDPNRLYTLENDIRNFNLFTDKEIGEFAEVFYDKSKDKVLQHPIIDRVVEAWSNIYSEDEKESFRSLMQSYIRLYAYIAQIATFQDKGLEKLYILLKHVNKKLPRRAKDNIDDITALVDLDSFRVEETFSGKITLENKDGEFDPMGVGVANKPQEEERDTLSQIIQKINELFGSPITEEDKIDVGNMQSRVYNNEELKVVMTSDNSETNKRHKFDEVISTLMLSYVNNRLEFYNKMEDPKVKGFISDLLYNDLQNYLRTRM